MEGNRKLIRISSDLGDWEAFYFADGSLIEQGHSVPTWSLLESLGFELYDHERDEEWFYAHGNRCPQQLDEDDPAMTDS
jgi:hypothetical protein